MEAGQGADRKDKRTGGSAAKAGHAGRDGTTTITTTCCQLLHAIHWAGCYSCCYRAPHLDDVLVGADDVALRQAGTGVTRLGVELDVPDGRAIHVVLDQQRALRPGRHRETSRHRQIQDHAYHTHCTHQDVTYALTSWLNDGLEGAQQQCRGVTRVYCRCIPKTTTACTFIQSYL